MYKSNGSLSEHPTKLSVVNKNIAFKLHHGSRSKSAEISQEIAKGRITGGFVLLMIQKSCICEIDR